MFTPILILASATFFADHCRAANGLTPAANRRRFGLCAAFNQGRLGDKLELTSRSGRRVYVTVTDRGGMGRDVVDLRPEAALSLMGQQYKVIGRLHGVSIRTVSRASRSRKHGL